MSNVDTTRSVGVCRKVHKSVFRSDSTNVFHVSPVDANIVNVTL